MARGSEVGSLRERMAGRAADIAAFTRAYGHYCWPVEGLMGLRLAPFGVLAGEGACDAVRDHHWQVELIDRLVAADPVLLAPTERMTIDLTEAAATAWWTTLTGAGGEGMVVKPVDALVHDASQRPRRNPEDEPPPARTHPDRPIAGTPAGRLVQPGVKCRGPEYLRIIYGPEYLREENLRRLRDRGSGRKQSLRYGNTRWVSRPWTGS